MSSWKEKSLSLLRNFAAEKSLSDSSKNSANLLQEKEATEKKLVTLLDEIKRIQEELSDLKPDGDENFIQYKCQLYELITNITWDLHSLPADVRGYVSKPFNVFNLSTETHSSYEISHYLWELISGEVETLSVSP